MMKKFLLVFCMMALFLVGCGAKDKAVEKVIEEIDSIGTVRLSDKDTIEQALNHYSQLTDRQKEAVENYVELMEAQDKLKELEEKAKAADTLQDVNEDSIFEALISDVTVEFISHYQEAEEEIILNQDNIMSAEASVIQTSHGTTDYSVQVQFDEEGTQKFKEATEALIGETISIVCDGTVVSAPVVYDVIENGVVMISGFASLEEAENLAAMLRQRNLGLQLQEVK